MKFRESLATKCLSLNNEACIIRPNRTTITIDVNESVKTIIHVKKIMVETLRHVTARIVKFKKYYW